MKKNINTKHLFSDRFFASCWSANRSLRMTALITALALSLSALFTSCNTLADEIRVEPSDWSEGVMATSAWLMAGIGTSKSLASDTLHLAYSEDGLTWTVLNSNSGIYTPTIGSRHIRDPYIFRKNDGTFVLLAEDYTGDGQAGDFGSGQDSDYGNNPSSKIYVAFSDDLITWKYEHLLKLTEGKGTNGATRRVQTPRAVYNKTDRCYDIYWTGDDTNGVNRTYVTQTYDFLSVKSLEDKIIFQPGHTVTDALVVNANNKYYLFARDARPALITKLGGDIQMAVADTWGSEFSILGSSDSISGYEKDYYINRGTKQNTLLQESEPCVYQLANGTWIMLVNDFLNDGTYTTYATTDINDPTSWEETSSVTKFTGTQMTVGTSVTRITANELDTLLEAF